MCWRLVYITAVRLSSIINCHLGVKTVVFGSDPFWVTMTLKSSLRCFLLQVVNAASQAASPRDVTKVRECGEEGGSRTVRRLHCEVCVRVHGAVPSWTAPLPSVSWQDIIWATEQACAERRGAHRSVSHSARCCCRRRSFILCPSAAADEEPDDTAVVWWVWL